MSPHLDPAQVLTFVGGIITAALLYLGTRYTAKTAATSTKAGQQMQNDLDWRKQMSQELADQRGEIDQLKNKMATLEQELSGKVRLLFRFGDWADALSAFALYGRQGPYPLPDPELAEFYSADRWQRIADQHNAQQGTQQ